MTETEQWRPIPGFDGAYEISNQGRVRSWKKWRSSPGPRIMKIQHRGGSSVIQLGLGGGVHDVARIMEKVWGLAAGPQKEGET